MLHSIAFRADSWIDMVGFEMLRGENSYQISYTITKGQGVLGKVIRKGSAFISLGDILHPSRQIRLRSPLRIEPDIWYCINIIIEIHEYEMYVLTSSGTDGRSVIATDSGVTIEYATGLDSSEKTTVLAGQIGGISFYRIDRQEEEFLRAHVPPSVKSSAVQPEPETKDVAIGNSVAVLPDYKPETHPSIALTRARPPLIDLQNSVKDIAIGDSLPILPDYSKDSQASPYIPEMAPIAEIDRTQVLDPMPDPDKTSMSLKSSATKYILPPLAGIISPPVRSQAVVRDVPPYK